jgi:acetyltransferase-like isoleucine patch superfamily enzyme
VHSLQSATTAHPREWPIYCAGSNAVVHPGVMIGRNVRVAANAVVTREVESDVANARMPAKVVRRD